ncbi:acylneuraminate cytidylyltransferase family protein [Methylomonas sp. EFPC3]|uniref:acylneuraminate cytidylyltransferase family protein n=1 Tax=Methylomonas sp. EFPC3 TaxID=3021710 RepID=UPI002415AAE5|nr:acylneuraminate cytidylyltransferase family protein [Methylomonas sp. EFPC3]WFP48598.1 acylneuraminate cytidylyltransferase family protein [Methylomonas sp. EFPC3]
MAAAFDLLVVVPARSGSKGLPDKNVRPLAGKPLLEWTAQTINRAGLPQSLALLSTDAEAYAEIGRKAGLAVPFLRPACHATDGASSLQVVEHALDWFRGNQGYLPAWVMLLQPTSPFRSPAILRQAMTLANGGNVDAVIGCKEIQRNLTTLFQLRDGFMQALDNRQPIQASRQQTQPLLTPNGAMYLVRTDYLLEYKSFYPPQTVPLVMNAIQSLDIDTAEDWAIAEAFVKQGLV